MAGSAYIVLNFSRFKPALNWNRFLEGLRRGSNSLNSDSVSFNKMKYIHLSFLVLLFWFWKVPEIKFN